MENTGFFVHSLTLQGSYPAATQSAFGNPSRLVFVGVGSFLPLGALGDEVQIATATPDSNKTFFCVISHSALVERCVTLGTAVNRVYVKTLTSL